MTTLLVRFLSNAQDEKQDYAYLCMMMFDHYVSGPLISTFIQKLIEEDRIRLTVTLPGYMIHIPSEHYYFESFNGIPAFKMSSTFLDPLGQRDVSVIDHYREKYKITLKYPQLPCLLVKNAKNASIWDRQCLLKNYYFPMELVDVFPLGSNSYVKDTMFRYKERWGPPKKEVDEDKDLIKDFEICTI